MSLLVVAGCGTLVPSSGGQADLTDTTWSLSTLMDKPIFADSYISALFTTDGKVAGSSGCNQYSGTYTVSGTTIQISSSLASTMMACSQELMEQESAYLQAFTEAKSFSINGDQLTLKDANNTAILVYTVQSQDLAGTSWEAVGVNNGSQAVTGVLAGTTITANFGEDGSLSGNGGCNEYNGPVKISGNQIGIGPLSSTKKACSDPAGVMDQEADYLAALENAQVFTVEGNVLELRMVDGALMAQFTRKE